MGPLKTMSMMRIESKHKFFTDRAKRTNNFINIAKTLANDHQEYISTQSSSYEDVISHSKKTKLLCLSNDFAIFQTVLVNITAIDLQTAVEIKFLKINSNVYRK